jgi:hypothetical protein
MAVKLSALRAGRLLPPGRKPNITTGHWPRSPEHLRVPKCGREEWLMRRRVSDLSTAKLLFICDLFNDAITVSDYRASNDRNIEWWNQKNVERSGPNLTWGTTPVCLLVLLKTTKNPSGQTIPRPRSQRRTSRIQARSFTACDERFIHTSRSNARWEETTWETWTYMKEYY